MTLSTGRAGAQHTFSIMYPLSYYRKLLYGFLIGGSTYWSELGYTGIVLLAVLLLLFGGKKKQGLRAGFVLMTLLLLFPFAGKMLNGGSYGQPLYVGILHACVFYRGKNVSSDDGDAF